MSSYTPKNILITGAAGFVASHVCNRLIRNYPEYNIVVLDKLDNSSNLKNLLPSKSSPNFKFVKGDVASSDLVSFLLLTEKIDTIMHFAAQTRVENSLQFTKSNINGTHVLLESCKVTNRIKRFIHVSTDEVYGDSNIETKFGNHETTYLNPCNPYSATKAGAEMLVMAYRSSYGYPVIITRGSNVYGPGQFPSKLIPKFILLAMAGKRLPVHGFGLNVRSYLYCDDVAEAFDVILHRGEIGQTYNIGGRIERTVIKIAKDILKLFCLNDDMIYHVENRRLKDKRNLLNVQKLKGLGWVERTSWEEGLNRTKDWYICNHDWWGDVSEVLLPYSNNLMKSVNEKQVDWPQQVKRSRYSHKRMHPDEPEIVSPYFLNKLNKVSNNSKMFDGSLEVKMKFLIYGRTGWIGELLGDICKKQGIAFEYGKGRVENRSEILFDFVSVKPTHVFNAVGVTNKTVDDWFDSHKHETIRTIVVGTMNLADLCRESGLILMNYAAGSIFEYNSDHPEGSGIGFNEEDEPNFTSSIYSKTMAMVEELLKEYDNVCTLRVKMPVSSNIYDERNFITTIFQNIKVVNIPNSMTVLDELLPISVEMAKRNLKGVWNLTNPGVICHNELLEFYKMYIDPEFAWANFTKAEQAKVIRAPRGDNELDASKLKREFPELLPIQDSLIKFVFEPNKKVGFLRSLTWREF